MPSVKPALPTNAQLLPSYFSTETLLSFEESANAINRLPSLSSVNSDKYSST